MITRVIWTFKNNEMAPASSRSTACVAPAARPVVLHASGRAAPHSLHPRASSLACGTLARSQLGNAAPLFDATAERWIVPPSSVSEDAGVAAELRHIHNAAHNRPAVVPQTQAAGRLDAVLDGVAVAFGMTVLCLIAGVLMVLA